MVTLPTLEWDPKYSVGVEMIDNQHKKMFGMINDLVGIINTVPTAEKLQPIIRELVIYKQAHFATEEKYFREFNYEGTAEHEDAHRKFNDKVEEITKKYGEDVIPFTFELIDFLEDWLVTHLMGLDQKYKKCFQEHGLK